MTLAQRCLLSGLATVLLVTATLFVAATPRRKTRGNPFTATVEALTFSTASFVVPLMTSLRVPVTEKLAEFLIPLTNTGKSLQLRAINGTGNSRQTNRLLNRFKGEFCLAVDMASNTTRCVA